MKTIKILAIIGVISVTVFSTSSFTLISKNNKGITINKPHFAVVELFTSEGCSSCPSADEAIASLQKEDRDKPVYILAFHVDYWNTHSWKDVFSSAENSKRQKKYADYLRLSSVYTPQVVVNGQKEFVGSEVGTLHNSIKAALQKDELANLVLSDVKYNQNKVSLHYQADGNDLNSMLVLALVQKNAVSHVKGGENGGRILTHVQIVQKFQVVLLSDNKSGIETFSLPIGFNPQGWEIIGFIQNTINGEIIGANKVGFGIEAHLASKLN